jgi:hypothetical protein
MIKCNYDDDKDALTFCEMQLLLTAVTGMTHSFLFQMVSCNYHQALQGFPNMSQVLPHKINRMN